MAHLGIAVLKSTADWNPKTNSFPIYYLCGEWFMMRKYRLSMWFHLGFLTCHLCFLCNLLLLLLPSKGLIWLSFSSEGRLNYHWILCEENRCCPRWSWAETPFFQGTPWPLAAALTALLCTWRAYHGTPPVTTRQAKKHTWHTRQKETSKCSAISKEEG